MEENKNDILDKSFDFYLYMGTEFTRQMNAVGVFKIRDLQEISLIDVLKIKSITIARLRRVIEFMNKENLSFKA
jgi:hypothetical protein